MIRLSKRGWNNVIIFTTLILIMLFNFSSDFLNRGTKDTPTVSTLIPEGSVITTIEFHNDLVERIGQGWRAKSGSLTNEQLAELVLAWQKAQVKLIDTSHDGQNDTSSIKVWFAGQAQSVEYSFFLSDDKTIVKFEQDFYQLISPDPIHLNIEH
ncbi:hypothetical protein [Paraglaciecola sp.]|uniref:hypothetical protein n=1 Tax=Paraglaciecola sp. TaxID=1920173 RepID=UPI003EF7B855